MALKVVNPKNTKTQQKQSRLGSRADFTLTRSWHSQVYIMLLLVLKVMFEGWVRRKAHLLYQMHAPPFTTDFSTH